MGRKGAVGRKMAPQEETSAVAFFYIVGFVYTIRNLVLASAGTSCKKGNKKSKMVATDNLMQVDLKPLGITVPVIPERFCRGSRISDA